MSPSQELVTCSHLEEDPSLPRFELVLPIGKRRSLQLCLWCGGLLESAVLSGWLQGVAPIAVQAAALAALHTMRPQEEEREGAEEGEPEAVSSPPSNPTEGLPFDPTTGYTGERVKGADKK